MFKPRLDGSAHGAGDMTFPAHPSAKRARIDIQQRSGYALIESEFSQRRPQLERGHLRRLSQIGASAARCRRMAREQEGRPETLGENEINSASAVAANVPTITQVQLVGELSTAGAFLAVVYGDGVQVASHMVSPLKYGSIIGPMALVCQGGI